MDDLVKRLRHRADKIVAMSQVMLPENCISLDEAIETEAADRIEELERGVAKLTHDIGEALDTITKQLGELMALEDERDAIREKTREEDAKACEDDTFWPVEGAHMATQIRALSREVKP